MPRERLVSKGDPGALKVRRVRIADVPRLSRFLDAEMRRGGWRRGPTGKHLRWKFFHPGLGDAGSYASFDDRDIVAFSGGVGRRLLVGGRSRAVTEGTDLFLASRYRGRGAAAKLLDTARERQRRRGFALRYGRPNGAALRSLMRLDYRRIGTVMRLVRPLSARVLRAKYVLPLPLVRLLRWPVALIGWLSLIPARLAGSFHGVAIEPIARFDERMDRLWNAASARFPMIVKDRAYMNGRYVDAPADYFALGAYRDDELAGVAVGRSGRDEATGLRVVRIVDLVTRPRDRSLIAYLLLGRLMERARAERCDLAWAELASTARRQRDPAYPALRAHGFLIRPQAGTIVVRALADRRFTRRVCREGLWMFRAGDTDQV